MVTERKPLKLPEFPTPWGEKELERMRKLEREEKKLREAYGVHFAPGVYEEKPWFERTIRERLYKAHPIEWLERKYGQGLQRLRPEWMREEPYPKGITAILRGLTPWTETGIVPEQADKIIRETEREIKELMRQEDAVQFAEAFPDYLLALAQARLLTGLESQLLTLFPQLDPGSSKAMELTEEERDWFKERYMTLSGKTPEQLLEMTPDEFIAGFPRALTPAEQAGQIPMIVPEPRFVLTTVSLSQDLEDITAALQGMYAPQVEEGAAMPSTTLGIYGEMFSLGLVPTKDMGQNIRMIQEAKMKEPRKEVIGDRETGQFFEVEIDDDNYVLWDSGIGKEVVSKYNPETKDYIPLTEQEEADFTDQIPFTVMTEGGEEMKLTWKLSDSTIWLGEEQVGSIEENGDFVPTDLEWWETALNGVFIGLEIAFAPFKMVGQTYYEWFVGAELREEDREKLDARTEEIMKEFDYPWGVARELAMGEITKKEYEALPFWHQLLFELPTFLGLGVAGVTATRARAALAPFTVGARGLTPISPAATAARAALAIPAGYEWLVGKTLYYGLLAPTRFTYNTAAPFINATWKKAPAYSTFKPGTLNHTRLFRIWKLANTAPKVGEPPDTNIKAAMNILGTAFKERGSFKAGFDVWWRTVKWADPEAQAFAKLVVGAAGASADASPSTAIIVSNVVKQVVETNIPPSAMTAAMIARSIPEGVVLEKPLSLLVSLQGLGYTKTLIEKMSPEEAWSTLLQGKEYVRPGVAVPPPELGTLQDKLTDIIAEEIITDTSLKTMEERIAKMTLPPDEMAELKETAEGLRTRLTDLREEKELISSRITELEKPVVAPEVKEALALTEAGIPSYAVEEFFILQRDANFWVSEDVGDEFIPDYIAYIIGDSKSFAKIANAMASSPEFTLTVRTALRDIGVPETFTVFRGAKKGAPLARTFVNASISRDAAVNIREKISDVPASQWEVTAFDVSIDDVVGVGKMEEGELFFRPQSLKEPKPPAEVAPVTPEVTPSERLKLFHGTKAEFADADIDTRKRMFGIHLTTDEAVAKVYGDVKAYELSGDAKTLDLSDGQDLWEFMKREGILDAEAIANVDLENYVLGGQLFQYDISSKTSLADDVAKTAQSLGYDLVKMPDNLGSVEGENVAYVVVNKEVLKLPKAEMTPPAVEEPVAPMSPMDWDKMPQAEKLSRASAAGIAKIAAKLPWSELTSVQQEKLQAVPFLPKEARAVDTEGLSPEDIAAGKHINKAVMKEQLEQAPEGLAEAPVDVEALRRLREGAREFFEKELFAADQDNPLSIALVLAAKYQDIGRYAETLPPDLTDPLPQEFLDATFNIPSRVSLNLQQPIDAAADIDWGRAGGVFRMKVLNPGIQAQQAMLMYQETGSNAWMDMEGGSGIDQPHFWELWAKKDFQEATYKLGEHIGEEDLLTPARDLLAKEEIADIVKGYNEEQQLAMVEFMKGSREFFEKWRGDANLVRVKMGKEPIPYIKDYLPRVVRINIWGKFFGIANKPEVIMDIALSPDLQKPSATHNPRELARTGGLKDYELEKDVRKLAMDYLGVVSKEMFYNPVIQRNKAFVSNLRGRDYGTIAGYLEDLTLRRMAGVPDPLTRWRQENVSNKIWSPFMLARRRLNPAVFGLNLPWNLTVQTSSFNFLWAMVEPKYVGKAVVDYLFNPATRTLIDKNVPSFIIKQKGRGSITFQDIGHAVGEYRKAVRSPIETVDDAVTIFTKIIERYLQGISARAGWLQGEAAGLKGAELVAYASDIAAKSQSEYDLMNLPLAYGSPEVRLIAPFQTFMFTALTRIREHTTIRALRAGEWATVDAPLDQKTQVLLKEVEGKEIPINSPAGRATLNMRLRHLLMFLAGVWTTNMVGEELIGREPWEEGSFIPMSNMLMLGIDPRNTWYLPMPLRYINDFWSGVLSAWRYGDFEPLANRFFNKYFMPGGFATSRALTYMEAANRGEYQDVKGDPLFEVEGFKASDWKAWFQGVWYTETGREYYERTIEGIEPETRKIIRDIELLGNQLGTDVDAKAYTLSKYGAEALRMAEKFGVPNWQIIDDITPYPDLFRLRLQCEYIWEEYYALETSKERLAYRRANPFIEATLIFWEKVKSYRSEESKEEFERLLREFTPDNPKAHWTGLERIPEDLIFEAE